MEAFWSGLFVVLLLWNMRVVHVNHKLRKADPFDLAWRRFARRNGVRL